MIASMTGFAARKGLGAGAEWAWEIRSVNGKGLDLRLRLPEWIDGLEPLVRAEVGRWLQRGSVSLALRLSRDAGLEPLRINPVVLSGVITALQRIDETAAMRGLELRPATTMEVMNARGVLDAAQPEIHDNAPLRAALMADLPLLLADFVASRKAEGAALEKVISAQIGLIGSLTVDAATEAALRLDASAANLRDSLARILSNADGVDETRLAQELAMMAVKTDITEEVNRLEAHVVAAKAILTEEGSVGRKLDFLMQEFNREANTLCSKAQSIALTRIGLDLKTVIDQMREQIQNVE